MHAVADSPKGERRWYFGVGNPDSDLMFVGEAPGFHEDKQGFPFVGQAGKLLDKLLAGIGLTREDVYIANVIKCRPPGNRDPMADEIEACEGHLFKQIEFIEPRLIATLGNFATKLLSGKPHGITRVHGAPQGGDRWRAGGYSLSDLPSGGGSLHARDDEDARRGLCAHPGLALRRHQRARSRAGRDGRCRRCAGNACRRATRSLLGGGPGGP